MAPASEKQKEPQNGEPPQNPHTLLRQKGQGQVYLALNLDFNGYNFFSLGSSFEE